MNKILDSVVSAVAGWLIWMLTYLASSTIRWTFIGKERFDGIMSKTGAVAVFWHGEFLMLPYIHRHRKVAIIISKSKDGDIATAVIKRYGFEVIRGSSTRGAESAILGTVEYLKNNYTIGLTGDGPKGPYHIMKPGPIWFAQKMDTPLIPVTVRFKHYVQLKSWDRFMIPMPFTKAVAIYGEPISMHGLQRREGMHIVQQRMEQQGATAEDMLK
jgi:lysophospholipid acyltransferase (LPLAT)-like uncharacterized protein